MSHRSQPAWRHHICGLYYSFQPNAWQVKKTYLPLVELEAHATILATTSRTQLTQIFLNPSDEKGIKEVRYTFPLYDGVSVVGFTCHVGDRTIVGEVKEKEKAKAVFKEAVARGETAGLLEQLPDASDVFSTTVGNVPPGAKVMIKITYLGELQHDMEVDGIRYTIPNIICPRYGSYPGTLRTSDSTEACGKSISITVDAEMADGSFIQKIQSPSHPIAMTMGMTSIAPHAEPTMSKASASLTLGTSSLESDFVVQIIAKDTGVPKAVLENHPTIPNHRALMATLVPKFALPAEKPEIVFICDQSGSMRGGRNELAVQALKVFLRSLPVGVKFNICAFGSNYEFLWPQSATYSQKSLDEATQHVATLRADYGGTEMLGPLKETIERRYKDMPLEVMLLTDGEIWNQQDLFTYLNESVGQSKAPIRVFTLGIGNGVSHALIEGIAKAGNGFSQTVGEGEMMDTKVVRMLKGALSPHISDYTLEVKYGPSSEHEDEDFEIVEKIAHSLKVKLDLEKEVEPEKPISLFDTSVDLDKDEAPVDDPTGEARYAHLPNIPVPKIIQAPQNIPALFAFNRTSIYLLLGPEAPSTTPKSVLLRGTSAHGPLELEIPIQILDVPGETVHQLAAKKAIFELEQGRGWLPEARDNEGILLKTRFEGKFSDMVEREAVRLGVQFQVGGKWCSFVAVESNQNKAQQKKRDLEEWEWLEDEEAETVVANKFSESLSIHPGIQERITLKQGMTLPHNFGCEE
ncbi:VIT-domain-containing protein [Plenodomus tracheiphilus IPT5]|uniref:VIT-domain-containing protein n=1 Tax=Plenodomus tracheiphilus IPT5 TaxID=1408161 RepID=A0A6A7B029_9PLEO|nr:VIT-domain-containing protein [Plenodomus tracheiphilus IPT5]